MSEKIIIVRPMLTESLYIDKPRELIFILATAQVQGSSEHLGERGLKKCMGIDRQLCNDIKRSEVFFSKQNLWPLQLSKYEFKLAFTIRELLLNFEAHYKENADNKGECEILDGHYVYMANSATLKIAQDVIASNIYVRFVREKVSLPFYKNLIDGMLHVDGFTLENLEILTMLLFELRMNLFVFQNRVPNQNEEIALMSSYTKIYVYISMIRDIDIELGMVIEQAILSHLEKIDDVVFPKFKNSPKIDLNQ